MEPPKQTPADQLPPLASGPALGQDRPHPADHLERNSEWVFIGAHGLRAGWSIVLFAALYYLFRMVVGTLFYAAGLVGETTVDSAATVFWGELAPLLALVAAVSVMALIEEQRIVSYNLAGRRRMRHFAFGLAAGFAALSLLVALLAFGGWLRLGSAALTLQNAVLTGALWAVAFFVVGFLEEGLFRCYVLSTLARGLNFWWALAVQAGVCVYLYFFDGGHGASGVYIASAIGLVPCFILHRKAASRDGFWQAAWVSSTFFALYHTSNIGENSVGILAAACIGFVFCVSIRLTGSAWWAIGCHAAWDWTETFFYGTADSGLQGQGHLLSASPAGNSLWSGRADGPEGSLLVFAAILLLLILLLAFYRRSRAAALAPAPQSAE